MKFILLLRLLFCPCGGPVYPAPSGPSESEIIERERIERDTVTPVRSAHDQRDDIIDPDPDCLNDDTVAMHDSAW